MDVRRVVTGFDASGRDIVVSDGPAHAVEWRSGNSMVGLWYLPAAPGSPLAGHDFEPDFELEPPPGGVWWRAFRTIPDAQGSSVSRDAIAAGDPRYDPDRPGFHRTDTIDFVRVVEGHARLELDEGAADIGPGDCIVQRGTWHSWVLAPGEPLVFVACMLRCGAGGGDQPGVRAGERPDPSGFRRLVTQAGDDGRSSFAHVGPPPVTTTYPNGTTMTEVWQTHGPVATPMQGGDRADGLVEIPPFRGGTTWRLVTLPAGSEATPTLDADGRDRMMHRTDTVDFVQVARGRCVMDLPGTRVELAPGDCVVQRGTWHAWRVPYAESCTLSVVMMATPPLPPGLGSLG